TSIPAREAQTPTSHPAPANASRSRAAYGAPDAPVMPRKTRTPALLGPLRDREEDADVVDVLLAPEVAEDRHDVVPELARVGDVAREERRPLADLPDRGQVGRAEVRGARAEVRVAGRAARLGEELGAGDGLRVPGEPFPLRPGRHGLDHLARERLLRGRALVGEDAHREHGEDR